MMKQVMKQQEDLKDQEHFKQVLFTAIGSFECIAFKCSENSKYSLYSDYCYFNKIESIDEAINKATLQYKILISMLDLLNNKSKTFKFPSNFNPKEFGKEINTWISEINSYAPSLCDNYLKTMKEIILK